ncbi:MAG: aminoacetone oxidase family FAD-binding enzyme [Lachnospiraceae bacterium]|nr:aminoacetone oxidase family FAD-binding enzyme [Lachnospiraceae bacterium]
MSSKDPSLIYDIAIIGGGASGMAAALGAVCEGSSVCIIEGNERVGVKILKTGNGRCNLTHIPISGEEYRGSGAKRIHGFMDRFGTEDTIAAFKNIGLLVRERDGYVYPYSENASSVLDCLRFAVRERGVKLYTSARAVSLKKENVFLVKVKNSDSSSCVLKAGRIILCTGGSADPKSGSDGSGYMLAKDMGLKVIKPLPALVKVITDDKNAAILSGVRAKGKVTVNTHDTVNSVPDVTQGITDSGEIQFTKDGLSGIPVFNVSRYISRAIDNKQKVKVFIDIMPDMTKEELTGHINRMRNDSVSFTVEELFSGSVNKKISQYIFKRIGINPNIKACELNDAKITEYVSNIKCLEFDIKAVYGFDAAQVTCGGVAFEEVDDDLQSIKVPGMYLAGEILDTDGPCGGYNLQWAWTSGYIAGKSCADEVRSSLSINV